MLDLRPQKMERASEEMLRHLKGSKLKPRFSVGVWYFYPGGGRFHDSYIDKGTIPQCIDNTTTSAAAFAFLISSSMLS